MFGSTFIELGLAISFLFLLLSLVCSLLSEAASKYFSWRAEMLEESIKQLLRDAELARHFYKHPMIRSLARHGRPFDTARRLDKLSGQRWPRSWASWLNRRLDLAAMPSYIKSTNFARAALDVIVLMPRLSALNEMRAKTPDLKAWSDEADRDAFLAQLDVAEFDTDDGLVERARVIAVLIEEKVKDDEARAALLSALSTMVTEPPPSAECAAEKAPEEAAANELAALQAAVSALANVEARRIFQSLVGKGRVSDRARAEAIVARYYDDIQERVSGWYKRKSQRWVFMIGISLALILNANTFVIADKLLRDNAVRAIVLAAVVGGRERYKAKVEQAAAPQAQPAPAASAQPAPPTDAPPTDAPPADAPLAPPTISPAPSADADRAPLDQIQELKSEIDKLSLPIGWPERPCRMASPILRAAALGVNDVMASLAAGQGPDKQVYERVASRVNDDAAKREAQAAKENDAVIDFEGNPRVCPDFVCGDVTWGSSWAYYLKKSALWLLKMAVGWIVTALGASLGAQFWYDALGKIISIRASKKPEDAKEPAATS